MADRTIDTDVLVIGGGMAGCFAAIKAREKGVQVTLVDKGYAGKSGQSPFAGSYMVFNPEWGDELDPWMQQISTIGEYVNNRVWTEIGILDSYARYLDLVSWGVTFEREPGGELHRSPPRLGPCRALHTDWRKHAEILRKQAIMAGAQILDRVMIVELVKQEGDAQGRIVGAVGLEMESGDLCICNAKSTVLATGAGGFKPPGWPIHGLTSDGDAMAYRAGAEITGKEYADPHPTTADAPAYFGNIMRDGRPIFGRLFNAEGDPVQGRGTLTLNMEFEAHAGRAPLMQETPLGEFTRIGGAASGMSVHKAEGIWPAGTDCSTHLPGLYAAGDALGTMQSGAVYAAIGMALSSASVTGARAGWAAADYALAADPPTIEKEQIGYVGATIRAPLERKGGFGPRWVTQVLQNTVIPYYVLYIKHGDRLQGALTIVEFVRDHLLPKLFARDPHELRLAIETRNMVLNAEMRLRSSLFRTESRGCHYREDYPGRDDKEWLAWILLLDEAGQMAVRKEPIPEEWWPDRTTPYRQRYPWRLPGEYAQ